MNIPIPPLAAYLIAAVTTVATLLASQALIDNRWEKLTTGLAGVLIPLGFLIANAIHHRAHNAIRAANIAAGHGDPAAKTRPTTHHRSHQ